MMFKKKTIVGFLVGVIVGLTVASAAAGPSDEFKDALVDKFFPPLVWLVTQIHNRYVTDVDMSDLALGAYDGILSRLDKYSAYIPADRKDEFEADTKGEFGGLGVNISFLPIKKAILVEQAIPGTPAFAAGVLPGDLIVQVVEQSTGKKYQTVDFKDVHDAVRILRGEPGSKIVVTVIHEKGNVVEDLPITRAIIKVPGVRAVHMLDADKKIGYIYVPYFQEHTVTDMKTAIDDLCSQGAKGIVLDLRFNPGGLLTSAEEFSDMFLDGQIIVSTQGLHEPEKVVRAHGSDQYPDLSLVVLVNRFSASAWEIVSAALGENGRAAVVGESTYGKASVQTLMDDPITKGAVKLTTAHYYTPKKNLIDGKGVAPDPDNTIKLSDEDLVRLRIELGKSTAYPPAIPGRETPTDDEEEGMTPAAKPATEAAPTAPVAPASETTPSQTAPTPAAPTPEATPSQTAPTPQPAPAKTEGTPTEAAPAGAAPAKEGAPTPSQTAPTPQAAPKPPEKPFVDVQLNLAVKVLGEEIANHGAPPAPAAAAAAAAPAPVAAPTN